MTTDVATPAEPRTRERVLEAYRRWGYLQADLDPLGRLQPEGHPELPEEGPGVEEARRAYSGTLAVETAHMPDPERRAWIYQRMEAGAPRGEGDGRPDKERILRGLVRAETFEQVLQSRYLGTKRFSIEGVTALVPMLWELLDAAGDQEAEQAVLAMSHRGRLSVMLNVVGR
ncbi:MAG TPA: 2-oxoglutarate dehydrogenase E1 component, partial [Thermoanaerobaculia bacterium]|nr:2-oxoglutarate dehydrogenase E1 component [Thermoanaerobaculia bacterium]